MKNRFDTFKVAGWLLDEAYDPTNLVNEQDESNEADETLEAGEEEEAEAEEEAAEELADEEAEVDAEEEAEAEEETEEEENPEIDPNDIAGRLDAIEDKLDDIADNKATPDEDETFDLDLANPVCPCCGARLNILNTVADTEEIADETTAGDDENTEDSDISAILAGETPEEGDETYGEDITTMDDSLDNVDDLGYGDTDYVSIDADEDEDEDED